MSLSERGRLVVHLVRPLSRASSLGPLAFGGALATAYVWVEGTGGFVDYRILVLRIAALVICMAAAFALDDATEDTLTSVPTPLMLRRFIRVGLVTPIAATWWYLCLHAVGDVPRELGGPLPASDLTLEASALLMMALAASCLGGILASDRLGGVLAGPLLFLFVALAFVLPGDYRLMLSAPAHPSDLDEAWVRAHAAWRYVAAAALAAFVYYSQDRGRYPWRFKLRRLSGAGATGQAGAGTAE